MQLIHEACVMPTYNTRPPTRAGQHQTIFVHGVIFVSIIPVIFLFILSSALCIHLCVDVVVPQKYRTVNVARVIMLKLSCVSLLTNATDCFYICFCLHQQN